MQCSERPVEDAVSQSSCRFGLPMRTALSSAPEGVNASAVLGKPDGYQPSVKYCLTSRADAEAKGVAMEVPRFQASGIFGQV